MPFTSTLLGAFVRNPLAVDIFALNLPLASLATQAIVMAVSIGLSWWSTAAAMYSWILMAVAPEIINRWSERSARG
jgi:hypothetical protein